MTTTEANLIMSYIQLREIVRDVIADMNDASQATEGASIESPSPVTTQTLKSGFANFTPDAIAGALP